jgi:hypothetical protein
LNLKVIYTFDEIDVLANNTDEKRWYHGSGSDWKKVLTLMKALCLIFNNQRFREVAIEKS